MSSVCGRPWWPRQARRWCRQPSPCWPARCARARASRGRGRCLRGRFAAVEPRGERAGRNPRHVVALARTRTASAGRSEPGSSVAGTAFWTADASCGHNTGALVVLDAPSQFARPPSAPAALRHDPTPERMDVLRWFRTYLDASNLQNSGPAHDWWSTSDLTVMSPAPYVTWLLGSVWPCSSGAPAPTLPEDQATGVVRRMTRRPTRFCSALRHRVPRWRTLVRDRDTTRAGTLY